MKSDNLSAIHVYHFGGYSLEAQNQLPFWKSDQKNSHLSLYLAYFNAFQRQYFFACQHFITPLLIVSMILFQLPSKCLT